MIGIFGGTFDPIHYGHLRTALDVMEALLLEEVRFLPLGHAVHRDQPQASPAQRLKMVKSAVTGSRGFVADKTETDRSGASYMVETLGQLRKKLGGQTLCLLLGSDAFNDFLSWRQPEKIIELCHIVIMARPGFTVPEKGRLGDMVALHKSDSIETLHNTPFGRLFFQPVTQLDISSTDIRRRAATGKRLDFLLPQEVITVIERESLYRD